jgi:NAD(P)-dependent dehydrogenase (short-subunit alcohol dehydrogenase family)
VPSALVTGASRGFGRELAEVFHGQGWTVFPLARSPEVATARARDARWQPIRADVGTAEAEEAIRQALAAGPGGLDLLVNNAGDVKKLRWLDETTPEDVLEHFRVHCVGALRCTRAALPFLRRSERPTVVNVSSRFGSIAGTAGGQFRGLYSYAIAKSAQNMLSACLDQELGREGIRVLVVHPGRLKTSVAAADADTEPREAARRLADWLETVDRSAACALHDLMAGGVIPW